MTKSELISALSEKQTLTTKQATDIVNLIFDGWRDTLTARGRIEIRGFGSFAVKSYQAYSGRNPRTGRDVKVKPKRLPFFKVGKELKDKVNR